MKASRQKHTQNTHIYIYIDRHNRKKHKQTETHTHTKSTPNKEIHKAQIYKHDRNTTHTNKTITTIIKDTSKHTSNTKTNNK